MTARYPSIDVIVNPAAGRGKVDVHSILTELLSGRGYSWAVHCTTGRGHATELARAAAARGVDLVVAAGGDGTANEVGSGLLDSEAVLGLMPMGSGNALARALGLPIDPAKALGEILDGDVRAIDVGTVAGRHFFSTAGVGLDAAVCHLYASRPDRRRGFLPYLALTLRAYLSYVPVETVITLADGVEIRTHPTIAAVANTSQFGNGVIIAPEALPDDGVLDLCVIDDTGVLRALWHSRRLFRGTIDRMPGVRLYRSRCIRIARPRPGLLQVDGEATKAEAILKVKILPRAVRVAVPRGGPR